MTAKRLPFLVVERLVDSEMSAVLTVTIISNVPLKRGWLETKLGPFPGEQDVWPIYEAEARRLGYSEDLINIAKNKWISDVVRFLKPLH